MRKPTIAASDYRGGIINVGGGFNSLVLLYICFLDLSVVIAYLEEFKESHGRSTVFIRGVQGTNDGVDL